jgi:hypothetical protein
MGWSLLDGSTMLCDPSSRSTDPRSSRVKVTISSWRRKPSPRSVWWQCTVKLCKDNSRSSDDETERNRSVHVAGPTTLPLQGSSLSLGFPPGEKRFFFNFPKNRRFPLIHGLIYYRVTISESASVCEVCRFLRFSFYSLITPTFINRFYL